MNDTVTGWRRWIPTDKWIGAFGVGIAGVLGTWVESGAFDQQERAMCAALIPALATAYFLTDRSTKNSGPVSTG